MDVNEIIIRYIEAVTNFFRYTGWQILVLIIFVYYRKQIPLLIKSISSRVKKISFNQVSIEFAQKVSDLKQYQSDENIKESVKLNKYLYDSDFEQLVDVRPDFSILSSWQDVETKLYQIGIKHYNFNEGRKLVQEGKLTSRQSKLIFYLKKLRNEVVHNTNINVSEKTAFEYRKACFEVLQFLDKFDDDSGSQ